MQKKEIIKDRIKKYVHKPVMMLLAVLLVVNPLSGCAVTTGASEAIGSEQSAESTALAAMIDPGYSNRDLAGTWEAEGAVYAEFQDNNVSLSGGSNGATEDNITVTGATAEGSILTITEAGVYVLSGSSSDGQIIVEATKDDKVQLVLNGLTLTNTQGAAIYIKKADKAFITLAEGSVNELTDAAEYNLAEDEDEPSAAVFSKDDLTINGNGALTVNANYKHGIFSKDDLVITGGIITVNSVNNGLRGKDSVAICGGTITLNTAGDGIKSTNSTGEGKGWISIDGGTLIITTTEGDGIQAETLLQITDGDITIVSGGGSANGDSSTSSDGFGFGGGGMPGGSGGGGMGGGQRPGNTTGENSDSSSNTGRPDISEGNFPQMGSRPGPGNEDSTSQPDFDGERPQGIGGGRPGQDGDQNLGGRQMPEGDMPDFDNTTPPEGMPEMPAMDGQNSQSNGQAPGSAPNTNGAAGDGADTASDSTATSDSEDASTKGIKAGTDLFVTGGTLNIDSQDDTVHSNGTVTITGGILTLATGDDGVHADEELLITGGKIDITESYEGLEGLNITITGGEIRLKSSDDGINASDGSGSSGFGGMGGRGSIDENIFIRITGGLVVVDAQGDGVDSNGNLFIDGGTLLVNGPTSGGDGAIDYEGTGDITGGTVVAAGSSGMAMGFTSTSTQASLSVRFSSTQEADTLVTLTDENGNTIVSFAPTKQFQSIVISSPDLEVGKTYTLLTDGSAATDEGDGLYSGKLSGGTEIVTTTLSQISTSISDTGEEVRSMGGMGGGGGGMPGGSGGGGGMGGGRGSRGQESEGSDPVSRPDQQAQ